MKPRKCWRNAPTAPLFIYNYNTFVFPQKFQNFFSIFSVFMGVGVRYSGAGVRAPWLVVQVYIFCIYFVCIYIILCEYVLFCGVNIGYTLCICVYAFGMWTGRNLGFRGGTGGYVYIYILKLRKKNNIKKYIKKVKVYIFIYMFCVFFYKYTGFDNWYCCEYQRVTWKMYVYLWCKMGVYLHVFLWKVSYFGVFLKVKKGVKWCILSIFLCFFIKKLYFCGENMSIE